VRRKDGAVDGAHAPREERGGAASPDAARGVTGHPIQEGATPASYMRGGEREAFLTPKREKKKLAEFRIGWEKGHSLIRGSIKA